MSGSNNDFKGFAVRVHRRIGCSVCTAELHHAIIRPYMYKSGAMSSENGIECEWRGPEFEA